MRELVDYLVSNILPKDSYDIYEIEDDENVEIKVSVDSEDIGKVIGKHGRIAKSIRCVVRASTQNTDRQFDVVFVERE